MASLFSPGCFHLLADLPIESPHFGRGRGFLRPSSAYWEIRSSHVWLTPIIKYGHAFWRGSRPVWVAGGFHAGSGDGVRIVKNNPQDHAFGLQLVENGAGVDCRIDFARSCRSGVEDKTEPVSGLIPRCPPVKAPQEDVFFVSVQYGTYDPVGDQQIRVQRGVFILGPVDLKAGIPPACV